MDTAEKLEHLIPGTLFSTGQLYATAEAHAAMKKYGYDPFALLQRYVTGSDWGALDKEQIRMTHQAIQNGDPISIPYLFGGLDCLCITTEPGRTRTTFEMVRPTLEGFNLIEYPPAPIIGGALFNPGRLYATTQAIEALQTHASDYLNLLRRYLTGDWETLTEASRQGKHHAIVNGQFVQALYRISEEVVIFIATQADRSYTTFEVWPNLTDEEDEA